MSKAKYYTELSFIDTETGEILKTPALVLGTEPTYVDKQEHVKIFVTFLQDLIVDDNITKGAIRLLLYMLNQLNWDDLKITLIPIHVIKDLGISKMTFYLWLNALLKKGIVVKTETKYVFELVPFTAIKGSQAKVMQKEAIKSEENQKRRRKKIKCA